MTEKILKKPDHNDLLKIIVIYAIFSALWIYLSDTAIGLFITDAKVLTRISVFKGFFFVFITSILLYQLVRHYILESRQLKEEIQNHDVRFSLLSETMMDAFVSVDMNGKILQYNEVYRNMLGYDADELCAKTYIDLTPDSWHVMESKIIEEQVIPNGYSEVYEKEYVRKDGTIFPIELRSQLIRDEQGNPLIMWAIVRDITGRKMTQYKLACKKQELEELNLSLEKRVENAIQEVRLRDQVLIQQNRLAAMGEMINNIAHQWRQPLNNIGLIIQNLQLSFKSGELTEAEMDEDIDRAMKLILHMSGTIDNFRNFFQKDKEKHQFSIAKAVSHAVGLVADTLKNNCIDIELKMDEKITVIGYENEYAHALLNIINNAKDILLEKKLKEPKILIQVFSENNLSVVTVLDNGGGIDNSILSKIFDPYFTTKGPDKGTGIGLYMSKVIIEKNMGGRLTAVNIGNGAEFRIELT